MIERRLTRGELCALAVASLALVALVHWPTIFLGFQPDGLLMYHPWTRDELRGALTGTWLGDSVDHYHRPLTSVLFAFNFEVFGLNSQALHIESMLMVASITAMLGWALWLEAGLLAAAIGIVMYVLHPVLLDSSIAGVQNQFQLMPTLMVVSAWRCWISRRASERARDWRTIFLLPVIGFYFKEDAYAVLPTLLLLQWLRARLVRDVPTPSPRLLGAFVVLTVVLLGLRALIFPEFETAQGFFGRLYMEQLRIAVYAPARTAFGMFAHNHVLVGATAFVLLLQIAGAVHARQRLSSASAWTWFSGLVLLTVLSLPLTLAAEIRSTRVQLQVLCAAVMFAGGAKSLLDLAASSSVRRWLTPLAAGVIAAGSFVQWQTQATSRVERFEPCSVEQLSANSYAQYWFWLPPDLRRWMFVMPQVCARGQFATPEAQMDAIAWPLRNAHVVMIHPTAQRATLAFEAPEHDTPMTVTVDGRTEQRMLRAGESSMTLTLTPTWRTRLRNDYRVDLTVDASTNMPVLNLVRVE